MKRNPKNGETVYNKKGEPSTFIDSPYPGPKGVRGHTPTYHEGANDERTAILAKVRRTVKQCKGCESLEKWLLRRDERYKKNPGGL